MERIVLKISYLGTGYHGWQVQPNGITVQQTLQEKTEAMFKRKIALTGCSRTDAGVHANEFYCHFDVDLHISEDGIIKGLNSVLPKDITVLECRYVDSNFHSRYSAKGKNYIYKIHNDKLRDSFTADRAWHIERNLDIDKMNSFCNAICGTRDFIGFSSSGRTVTDTVRTVSECFVVRQDDLVVLSVTANGFLYNMVRIIVGTAVDISLGNIECSDYSELIDAKDRSKLGITAPPHGLYLNKVIY